VESRLREKQIVRRMSRHAGREPQRGRPVLALQHLDDDGLREEIEENRRLLFDLGLWGVPRFRLLGEGDERDLCVGGKIASGSSSSNFVAG
jgi:hypothetical protein